MIVTTNHDAAESLGPEEEFGTMTTSNDWVVRVRILRKQTKIYRSLKLKIFFNCLTFSLVRCVVVPVRERMSLYDGARDLTEIVVM